MKRWRIILASVLALLVLIVTPLLVMAAGKDTNKSASLPESRVRLAIVHPWTVPIGYSMQLTVFERLKQTPVSNASVWTIEKEKVDTVKQALKTLTAKGLANVTEKDYEDILNLNGKSIGLTDKDGKLIHTFNDPAVFWLVTLKNGYLPGFSHLTVKEALAITAPGKAAPGESVNITVSYKDTSDPVNGAAIWAIDASNAKVLKDKIADLKKANQGNLQNFDWKTELSKLAVLLGTTSENGQISHSFDKGSYLLIATLKGNLPAYTSIVILPSKAPSSSPKTPAGALH